MRIVSSYKVEIVHQRSLLKKTMEISRAASAWLDPVIESEWETLSSVDRERSGSTRRKS